MIPYMVLFILTWLTDSLCHIHSLPCNRDRVHDISTMIRMNGSMMLCIHAWSGDSLTIFYTKPFQNTYHVVSSYWGYVLARHTDRQLVSCQWTMLNNLDCMVSGVYVWMSKDGMTSGNLENQIKSLDIVMVHKKCFLKKYRTAVMSSMFTCGCSIQHMCVPLQVSYAISYALAHDNMCSHAQYCDR